MNSLDKPTWKDVLDGKYGQFIRIKCNKKSGKIKYVKSLSAPYTWKEKLIIFFKKFLKIGHDIILPS
jgi:hypothetical protein